MKTRKFTWAFPLVFGAGGLLLIGPSLTSCSSTCSDEHSCGTYQPPDGTSGTSGSSGADGGASSGNGGKATTTGGKAGNTSGGSGMQGGATGEAGAAGSAGAEGGAGGSPVQLPCNGACTTPKAVCDEPNNTCVECLQGTDCTGSKKKCDTVANACVECLAPTDCSTAVAAKCDGTGTCVKCTSNDDCSHIAGKTVCDTNAGACVQCTAADETACGGKSCNPATKACTNTTIGSVGACSACVADSECSGGGTADPAARCVPMLFKGVARAGGFCLKRVAKTCAKPFQTPITTASLSGSPSESYCGIDQDSTRCEAVLDLIGDQSCADGQDTSCGCSRDGDQKCTETGKGGLCKTVGVNAKRCTYTCGTAGDCPTGKTCTVDDPYCH